MKKRILVDMDGVLADFELGVVEAYRKRFPQRPHLLLKNKTSFYLSEQYPKEHEPDLKAIYTAPNFFRNLPAIEGGVDAVKQMDFLGHEVFFCTSPLSAYENCVEEKFAWIEKHFGIVFTKKVVIAKDKTIVSGNYLIDDRSEVTGVISSPDWEHILYDQPYNKNADKRRLTWKNYKEILGL